MIRGARPDALRRQVSTVAIAAAVLALSACAPGTPTATTSAATPSESPTSTPQAMSGQLVVSIDGLELLSTSGDTVDSVAFTDGEAVVSFLGDALGSTPTGIPNSSGYPITSYDWGAISASVIDGGPATVWIAAAAVDGLEIETTEGVQVGMTRTDAVALGAVEGQDETGDGLADYLSLQEREAPGTESLLEPGQTGVDFILVILEDDAVARMISPANDWGDL